MSNPYDGTAAVVVPQNIEKMAIYHWRPGSRVLCVGSRDGASFVGDLPDDEQRTFRRAISPELISHAAKQVGIATWAATWTASLRYPQGIAALRESGLGSSVVVTSGHGEGALLQDLLAAPVDAWSLLLDAAVAPQGQTSEIFARAKHLEVSLGLSAAPLHPGLAALPWHRVSAVHLIPLRPALAVGADLQGWEAAARALLPAELIIYDSQQQQTLCRACGEALIWRSSGRSRLALLKQGGQQCSACGCPSPVRW